MIRKINFFTFLIFVYSVIICVTFKKDANKKFPPVAENKNNIKPIDKNDITVMNAELKNKNQ